MADCNLNIENFCEYKKISSISSYKYHYSDIFDENLSKIIAYVKKDEKEIEVTFKLEPPGNPHIMPDSYWYDDTNNRYNCENIYLKAGTEWWFKYHILSLNKDCVRTHIESFDKKEMFTYAVTFGKLPEDIVQTDSSTTDNDKNILSILPLLKPDSLNNSDNYNILLIACKRLNLKLVIFLVENCGIKLSAVIHKSRFSSNKYLLNELFELYYSLPGDVKEQNSKVLITFIENLITYAATQEPSVNLVNQTVIDNVLEYTNKQQPYGVDKTLFTTFKDNYISLLSQRLLESPPQQSIAAKVCDALTPGCLKTRRVHADAGGSKKRVKKTRKQRKPCNSKRNHKK